VPRHNYVTKKQTQQVTPAFWCDVATFQIVDGNTICLTKSSGIAGKIVQSRGMKMRRVSLIIALMLSASAPAVAYENYIPLGAGYSTRVNRLPAFDSDEGKISQETDVYESELYRIKRKSVEDDSRFRQFFSSPESTGVDTHIDY
jgi:hypothetical protein